MHLATGKSLWSRTKALLCLTDVLCSCRFNQTQSLCARAPPAKPIPRVRNYFAADFGVLYPDDRYHIIPPYIMVFVYMSLSHPACKHLDCSVFKEYLTCTQYSTLAMELGRYFLLETDMEVQNRK